MAVWVCRIRSVWKIRSLAILLVTNCAFFVFTQMGGSIGAIMRMARTLAVVWICSSNARFDASL